MYFVENITAVNVIKTNLQTIEEVLEVSSRYIMYAEGYAIAYPIDMFRAVIKSVKDMFDIDAFIALKQQLDEQDSRYWENFTRKIKFEQLEKELVSMYDRGDLILYIWRVKAHIQYLRYCVERIKDQDTEYAKDCLISSLIVCK